MSRARSITLNGEVHWFDMNKNHRQATDEQLELLATVEDVDLEDLLESNVTQGDVIKRLREALGHDAIPLDVIRRRQAWREARRTAPNCRMCDKVGDSTRHHFVNRWILRELEDYASTWADRKQNCIPVCIDCHRDLHDRSGPAKSIADRLSPGEKEFANRALAQLAEERPKLLILIAKGDDSVYEARLVKDWIEGLFDPTAVSVPVAPEKTQTLTAVA